MAISLDNKEAVRGEEQRRETDEKLSELSSENAETFKQVYESHVSRPEFKEHPRMKENSCISCI